MRKTSRTYKKSIKVATDHFLCNFLCSSTQIYPTNTFDNVYYTTSISNSSPYLSLSTGNVSSLYVYTNIIHSQYVGNVKVPLLRIVGIERQHRKSVTKTFDRLQYLSVCRQTLDTIEINIKDDADDSISLFHLNTEKVAVKLHFRKQ